MVSACGFRLQELPLDRLLIKACHPVSAAIVLACTTRQALAWLTHRLPSLQGQQGLSAVRQLCHDKRQRARVTQASAGDHAGWGFCQFRGLAPLLRLRG